MYIRGRHGEPRSCASREVDVLFGGGVVAISGFVIFAAIREHANMCLLAVALSLLFYVGNVEYIVFNGLTEPQVSGAIGLILEKVHSL